MKDAKPFSVLDSPIDSRMLIEASAGTGKTYNITGVFIRLLIEQKATLEQILVVTFTRMATKELKERVLNLLRKVLRAVETGKSFHDPFLERILNSKIHREKASATIRDAIRNFDDARIYTIHGFSQQVLREESLTAGVPFDNEVIHTDDLLKEAADDFWRDFVFKNSDTDQGRYLIDKLLNFGSGPEELLDVLMPTIQYDDAEIIGAGDFDPYTVSERIIQLREELRDVWTDQKEEIVRLLIESDVKYMTERNVQARAAAMDTFLVQPGFAQDSFEMLRFFLPSYFSENIKKNKNRVPVHRFFGLCENYAAEEGNMARISTWLLEHASRCIIRLRREKSRGSEIMTYDDLLDRLLEALSDEEQGEALAIKLREKYPFALVDEFQDTDPVQYRIFEKIYPLKNKETSLMMIGDPKQAIYAFRGADLYAYIRAREEVLPDSRYTLRKNFRSTPDLIEAVNLLFRPDHNSPFLDKEISYHSIEPGYTDNPGSLMLNGSRRAPLRIYCSQGIRSKSDIRQQVLKETAFQVAALIQQGMEGKAIIHDGKQSREVISGDIAVLVHSHKEAETVKEFLRALDVRSATYSREKVFESREAERLELLLTAVLDPLSGSSPRAAAVSGFFGNRLSEIVDLLNDEERLPWLSGTLQELNDFWYREGIYPMMRKLLFEFEGLNKLSELHNGERVVTNLQQLFELTANTEIEHAFDPPGLLRWFRKKISDAGSDDEETLRLESDENLVKITTIHNSKGLQFPVVFCPTLWNARDYTTRNKIIETYHELEYPFKRVVNLEQSNGSKREEARFQSHFEEISEEVRKAYVAVTRAMYECRIFWGASNTSQLSGLGALLSGEEQVKKSIREKLKLDKMNSLDESDFISAFESLAQKNPGIITFDELKQEPVSMKPLAPKYDKDELSVKDYRGDPDLKLKKQLFSFSSLTNMTHSAVIEPDYDQYLEEFIEYATSGLTPEPQPVDLFHFPKGTTAGTFIHKLFEHEDFDFRKTEKNQSIVEDLIGSYGFEEKWIPVLDKMLADVSNAELGNLSLDRVGPNETLKEMEFYYPAARPELDNIKRIIRIGSDYNSGINHSKNYLNGFIDLILKQNDTYYILDYKSNYLGNTVEDYTQSNLQEEIRNSDYDVQYHLYILALIKYLGSRLSDFSYASFGGVYYLFVRGMRAGKSTGVYYDRPDEEIINKLQKLLYRDAIFD